MKNDKLEIKKIIHAFLKAEGYKNFQIQTKLGRINITLPFGTTHDQWKYVTEFAEMFQCVSDLKESNRLKQLNKDWDRLEKVGKMNVFVKEKQEAA